MILPAVRLSRTSPPRGGEYLHEVTAGSMRPRGGAVRGPRERSERELGRRAVRGRPKGDLEENGERSDP
ncbi:hypothetical protein BRD06_00530 [Halobacteriales archaeon QS_9_67_15]|nr:MAG: hypothetical protein BRD06_00530 [Halobacteriales archaeon QS_9_67_15]